MQGSFVRAIEGIEPEGRGTEAAGKPPGYQEYQYDQTKAPKVHVCAFQYKGISGGRVC